MDIEYLLFLQNVRNSCSPIVAQIFSVISDAGVFIPVLFCAFIWLCVDKKSGYLICASLSTGLLATSIVKNTCCVYRPWILDSRVIPLSKNTTLAAGYSFPSGHSAAASSFAISCALVFKKKIYMVLSILFVFLIGFSRNFVGVHTPQDVLTAIFIGTLFAVVNVKIIPELFINPKNPNKTILFAFLLLVLLCVYVILKPYPLDYNENGLLVNPVKMQSDFFVQAGMTAGFMASWYIDVKYTHYEIKGTLFQKILSGVVLILISFLWYYTFRLLKPVIEIRTFTFLRVFTQTMVMLSAGPLIFKLIAAKFFVRN